MAVAKPNLHPGVWLLAEFLSIAGYTVKSSRLRYLIFVAIVSLSAYALLFTTTDFRYLGMGERGIASRLPMLVSFASANMLLCDPHRDLRRKGHKGSITDAPFLSRLWWGALLWTNPRGLNYTNEPKDLPPRPLHRTKATFIVEQLQGILLKYLIFDAFNIVNRANPILVTNQTSPFEGFHSLWWFAGLGFGGAVYALTAMQYHFMVLILVASGVSQPYDCPDLYGSPLEAYTVRRLWSKFWHQILRLSCIQHGKFVVKQLRLGPGLLSTTVLLFVTFLISGLIHWISEAVVAQTLVDTVGTLWFFLAQVAAIIFEEAIMKQAHKIGFTKSTQWTRAVGYLWVYLWANFSLPLWTGPGYKFGWANEFPRFSIIFGIGGGVWFL